jgi:PfaB family protein
MNKTLAQISQRANPFFEMGFYLLPISFSSAEDAARKLGKAREGLTGSDDLEGFIRAQLSKLDATLPYALSLLGASRADLLAELERAQESLPGAFESGRDWQTPAGSYFSPRPLGAQAQIAFVYPGAFGTYVGMGRQLFQLFPQLSESLDVLTDDPQHAMNAEVIFPQTEDPQVIAALQDKLQRQPTLMISSGIFFSYLFTVILQDIFKLQPSAAFGYSLGENSMMFATGIWTQADAMRTSLEASPLFHERVSGRQNAIREYWQLPESAVYEEGKSIWANYILMASEEKVRAAIQPGERVYITHINTSRQVVIGGDEAACLRVADGLKCMHLKAPYEHAIHCQPVESEFEAFERMHYWPVEHKPEIPVYSAADYVPLEMESHSIARSFAHMLTHAVDFPRLVEQVYADGARVFIELGAGSNCSKWVDAILKDRPHASMTINQNNVSDNISILKLLARLIGQRVALDLSVLSAVE